MRKIILIIVAMLALPAVAVQTSHWTHTNEADFKNGTMENVVATNLGDLKLSRAVKTILEEDPKMSAVYALAAGKDGTIYAGTGPQGVVLQIKGDKVSTLVKLDDVTNIFSLAIDKDGALLIGTGGESGKIFRMTQGGKPKEIFTADGVQYIWCITQSEDGNIYAGTGPNGQLFVIKPDGAHEVLLDTDENNLLCMTSDGKDTLYVGTDPNGLVYRINRKTKEVYVLHDAAESEIGCLALDDEGNLYAATAEAIEQAGAEAEPGGAAEKAGRPEGASGVPIPTPARPEPKPPQVPDPNPGEPDPIPKDAKKLMMFDMLPASRPSSTRRNRDERRRPVPPGHPDGPPSTEPSSSPSPGITPPTGLGARAEAAQPREGGNAIYKIDKEGLVREIFRQPVLVLSMIARDGTLLVGTGSEGQIYQINPQEEETVVLAKVEAKQVMAMLPLKDRIILGLANTGGLSAMTQGFASEGTYTSAVLDAQQVSRFGRVQLHGTLPAGTSLKVQTRSGNLSEPGDQFWSKWSQAVAAQQFLPVTAPAARFLQYRFTFTSSDGTKTPVVDDVDVAYQAPNLPPAIKSVEVAVHGAENANANAANAASASANSSNDSHTQTITWEASDPNSDDLVYSVYYRNGSRSPWILLKDKLKDATYDWDTRTVGDGRYEVKVVASDEADNSPGAGRQVSRVSDPIIVDNTPPTISGLKASSGAGDIRVEFAASDRTSTLSSFAFTVDSSDEWQTVLPSDKIADSPDETVNFSIHDLKAGAHQIAVRAMDARGNQSVATVNVTVDAPAKP